jgi:hypothetical protein
MTSHPLSDLETKAAAGEALTVAEAQRVLATPDLVSVGVLGETARKALRGERVTYGRVAVVSGDLPETRGEAGEVRLIGRPASIEEARERVRAAAPLAGAVPLSGFSVADLLDLVGSDHLALAELAAALRADGLTSVAEVPIDRLGETENAVEVVRAIVHGGLGAWRATVYQAPPEGRLMLLERAAVLQRETGVLRALAPLPRVDPVEAPSSGYDDVRTVAAARLLCARIPSIQVDWPLYGPKLAQVAIAFGADDIDGVAATDVLMLGHRRSPREEVERQIRAASGVPAERNGRYEPLT